MNSFLDILRRLQQKNPVLKQRIAEASAFERWERAVGTQIARHTRAIRVQDGVLWIEVDHPIWKSELHHRKRQILALLNQTEPMPNPPPAGPPIPAPQEIIQDLLLLDPRGPRK
jgi:predicted nucleic acid-binding Zn ribbon protein